MNQELKDKIAQLEKVLKEAEEIAEKTGESFGLYPAYGMGGVYIPKSTFKLPSEIRESMKEKIENDIFLRDLLEECDELNKDLKEESYGIHLEYYEVLNKEEIYYDENFGWRSSSSSC